MGNSTKPWEISLRDFVTNIFRYKGIFILCFITIITGSSIVLKLKTTKYEAQVKILIQGAATTAAETYQSLGSFRIHMTQAEIVKSTPVIQKAVFALKLHERPLDYEKQFCSNIKKPLIDFQVKMQEKELSKLSPEQRSEIAVIRAMSNLRANLTTYLVPHADIFIISVTAFSPEDAVETANAISRSYTIFDQQRQLTEIKLKYGELHPSVVQLKDNIEKSLSGLSGKHLPDEEAIGTASVKIIEQAVSNKQPVGKPKKLLFLIAVFMSFFVGIALSLFLGFINQSFKSPQEIVSDLKTPLLGSITVKKRREPALINTLDNNSTYYRFYEELTDQVHIFMKTQQLKSLIVTTPYSQKQDSYIVPNIGFCLSKLLKLKTIIIDVNFQSPQFKNIFKTVDNKNLQQIKSEKDIFTNIIKLENNADILITEKNPQKIATSINSINLKKIIHALSAEYDLIIVDALHIINMNDLSHVAEHVDGIAIVIHEGKERKQKVINAIYPLRRDNHKIVGAIMGNRTFPIPQFIYNRF